MFFLPSDTARIKTSDLATARTVRDRVGYYIDERSSYIAQNGIDPAFGLPGASWSHSDTGTLATMYRCVAKCDSIGIERLRAFTAMFSGNFLYELGPLPSGTIVPSDLSPYTDARITELLKERNRVPVQMWKLLTSNLDPRWVYRPPLAFGEIGELFDGVIVNVDTMKYQAKINAALSVGLLQWLDAKPRPRILEIGGGYGALAYALHSAFPNSSYTIIDLPECLLFSGIYLTMSKNAPTSWGISPINSGFRFVPNYMALDLHEPFDLVINTFSFAEMRRTQATRYIGMMKSEWLQDRGPFYEFNENASSGPGKLPTKELLAGEFSFRIDPRPRDSASALGELGDLWASNADILNQCRVASAQLF